MRISFVKMLDTFKLKEWLSWPLIRAHLCTFAVALSYNSIWRAPRYAFRYGGLEYALVLTVAMVTVAMPITLLQLAVGQLSQQDAVGVWRAVPFFRGVGYLRLLISLLCSVYSIIYTALSITYFLYTISNSIPFKVCIEWVVVPEGYNNSISASECLSKTFMSPVSENLDYYLAVALIVLVLWIIFPFLFYNPVKLMKRIFYVLCPVMILLGIIILSCIGHKSNILSLENRSDWRHFLLPNIWHGAAVQSLLSCQIAGGYIISAGDSIYANTNVQWTALIIVGANLLASWAGLIFWFGISGAGEKDTDAAAVLVEAYRAAEDNDLNIVWPSLIFATLILSGVISMLALLYPIYDRLRRIGGIKWRLASITCSLGAAAVSLVVLAGRLPVLSVLEDIAVPLLISVATVLEILAFVFIYGWKILLEDVEFLTGNELPKFWVWGWLLAPFVITPFTTWWLAIIFIEDTMWKEPPWTATAVVASTSVAFIIFVVFAVVSVVRQVQYDLIGKLKSSFQPSRRWGPRDPITHYYWLAKREDVDRGNVPRSRYYRRELGQLSGGPSFLTIPSSISLSKQEEIIADIKRRSNSDDWLYTAHRKQHLCELDGVVNENRVRSKSLDWDIALKLNKGALRNANSNVSREFMISIKGDNKM